MQGDLFGGFEHDIPAAYNLPDTELCQQAYLSGDEPNMGVKEDLKLSEQPIPTAEGVRKV